MEWRPIVACIGTVDRHTVRHTQRRDEPRQGAAAAGVVRRLVPTLAVSANLTRWEDAWRRARAASLANGPQQTVVPHQLPVDVYGLVGRKDVRCCAPRACCWAYRGGWPNPAAICIARCVFSPRSAWSPARPRPPRCWPSSLTEQAAPLSPPDRIQPARCVRRCAAPHAVTARTGS
jgi:hypothetical protein